MALIIKGGEIPVDCLGCDEMVMLSQCPIHINEPLKYCDGTRHPGCPILGEIPDKHGDLVEISKVKEAQRIHGQASPWDSYVPIIVEATE